MKIYLIHTLINGLIINKINMKKIIAYPVAHILFHIGDFISKYLPNAYDTYSWCMETSGDIQDWSGLKGPWKKPNV